MFLTRFRPRKTIMTTGTFGERKINGWRATQAEASSSHFRLARFVQSLPRAPTRERSEIRSASLLVFFFFINRSRKGITNPAKGKGESTRPGTLRIYFLNRNGRGYTHTLYGSRSPFFFVLLNQSRISSLFIEHSNTQPESRDPICCFRRLFKCLM